MHSPNTVAVVNPPQRRSASAPPASLSEAVVPKLSSASTISHSAAAVVPSHPVPVATAPRSLIAPSVAAASFEPVTEMFIVYDADGTPAGELVYLTKKMLGLGHCAACDITHGPRKEKPEFTQLKTFGWGAPLVNIHRDEMDPALAAAVGERLPCVVARTISRDVLLLGQESLATCEGDVFRFQDLVNLALRVHRLSVPPAPLRRAPAMSRGVPAAVPVLAQKPTLGEWETRKAENGNRQLYEGDAVVPR